MQRLLGVALIGQLLAHVFPMFIGPGGNGKTTLLSIAHDVLGSYARTMPPKFLVEKRSEQHPTEIANLQGAGGLYAAGMYVTEVDIHESALLSALEVAARIAPQSAGVRDFRAAIEGGRMPVVRRQR